MKTCPFCGGSVSDQARFCGHCGRSLKEQLVEAPPQMPGPPEEVPEPPAEAPAEAPAPPAPVEESPPVAEPAQVSAAAEREEPAEEWKAAPVEPVEPVEPQEAPPPTVEPAQPKPPPAREKPLGKSLPPAPEVSGPLHAAEPTPRAAAESPPRPRRRVGGWVWGVVALVMLIGAAGGLLAAGVIRLPSLPSQQAVPPLAPTPWPTNTLQPRNTPAPAAPLSCQGPFEGWADLESAWLGRPVTLDGRITRAAEEWSDAPCVDLVLNVLEGEGSIASTWWLKNDDEWVYLLARIPVAEGDVYGVAMYYFWPQWEDGWEYSDGAWMDRDGDSMDAYGWDGERWSYDDELTPPGTDNVQGAWSTDGTYLWFEFRKRLQSGEDYDWVWTPGETVGTDVASLLVGAYDGTWHQIDIGLRIGEP